MNKLLKKKPNKFGNQRNRLQVACTFEKRQHFAQKQDMSQDEGDCFEGLDLNQPWVMESCRLNCVHHPEKVFKYVGHFGCRHAIPRLEFRLGYSSHSLEEEDLKLANTPLQDVDQDTAHLMYEVFLSSGDYAWIRRLADIANTTDNMEVIRYVDKQMRVLQRKQIVSNMDGAQPLATPPFMFHFKKRLADQMERDRWLQEWNAEQLERDRLYQQATHEAQLRRSRLCAIL